MIGILLVAASTRTRRELELRLERSEVEVVGSVADVETAAEELLEKDPDVLLVSVENDSRDELLETLEEMHLTREVSVVLLVQGTSPNFVQRSVRAGVRGILPAEIEENALQSALQVIARGLIVLSPEEVGSLQPVMETSTETAEAIEGLTPREKEVLQKMASGLGNKEVAARLRISEHTVKFHVASILGKLGASSRTEAVSIGMRRGLILL